MTISTVVATESLNECWRGKVALLCVDVLTVDFGHMVWLERMRAVDDGEDEEPYEQGQKRLRFVSFPGVRLEGEGHAVRSGIGGNGGPDESFKMEGTTRTLAIPKELEVETINIDRARVQRHCVLWVIHSRQLPPHRDVNILCIITQPWVQPPSPKMVWVICTQPMIYSLQVHP